VLRAAELGTLAEEQAGLLGLEPQLVRAAGIKSVLPASRGT
jgi:hypothetical protein